MITLESCYEQCRELLLEQHAALVQTHHEALATAEQTAEAIADIDRALAGVSAVKEGTPRKSKTIKAKRPCSNKQEVLQHIHRVLGAGPLDAAQLKTKVAQQLRDKGKNLSMFPKLYDASLKDPSLQRDDQGIVTLRPGARWSQPS